MILTTKGIDQVLKIYMLSLSDIPFSQKNITVTILDKNVTVLTFKEYMLAKFFCLRFGVEHC